VNQRTANAELQTSNSELQTRIRIHHRGAEDTKFGTSLNLVSGADEPAEGESVSRRGRQKCRMPLTYGDRILVTFASFCADLSFVRWSEICAGDPRDRASGPGRNQPSVQLCACPFPVALLSMSGMCEPNPSESDALSGRVAVTGGSPGLKHPG